MAGYQSARTAPSSLAGCRSTGKTEAGLMSQQVTCSSGTVGRELCAPGHGSQQHWLSKNLHPRELQQLGLSQPTHGQVRGIWAEN